MKITSFTEMWHIYTMEYYSAIKNNETMPHGSNMDRLDLEDTMLSERSQRKTNSVGHHLYVESKKVQQTSEYNKKEADL